MTNYPKENRQNQRPLKAFGELDAEIGSRIRLKRKMIGMSLFDLGANIGVSYQQMQKYESGTNRISVSSLIFIAAALNTDPASLLFGLTPGGREGGVDARAQLAASAGAQRLNRLFAELNNEQDRALVVRLTAYLAARESR
jgi:transcriptional regulator with XRE-family HTH domain